MAPRTTSPALQECTLRTSLRPRRNVRGLVTITLLAGSLSLPYAAGHLGERVGLSMPSLRESLDEMPWMVLPLFVYSALAR